MHITYSDTLTRLLEWHYVECIYGNFEKAKRY